MTGGGDRFPGQGIDMGSGDADHYGRPTRDFVSGDVNDAVAGCLPPRHRGVEAALAVDQHIEGRTGDASILSQLNGILQGDQPLEPLRFFLLRDIVSAVPGARTGSG